MFVGIDLGTSNSTLAVFDGETVTVVGNALGEALTPSVVHVDRRGGLSVGRPARRFLATDPGNTRAEFKRLMGTAEAFRFEASGRSLGPEDLSAHVLTSLLADARDALGFVPRAAVISTPALFELPQNHATMRAGKLAGLEEVVLIQEPIASAIAAGWREDLEGTWLVFDLGGGTLDVSLLETKGGRLRVVDHAGDNFLGGKDFDQVVVDWAVSELRRGFQLPELDGAHAEDPRVFAKLKAAAEQTRIDLSRAQSAVLCIPELCADAQGNAVDVDLALTRSELDRLLAPLVARSLGVVQGLLAKNQRAADEVARVVFVGGPTCTPSVRARVGEIFGGRIVEGMDPMTIVARGAALYAASAGLDARPVTPVATARPGLAIRIEHPPVTSDLEPFVVGRFMPAPGEPLPDHVRIDDDTGAVRTSDTKISTEGSFVLQVKLARHRQNRFRVLAFDAEARQLELATAEFTIVHGVSVADPPLSRSVGVACADDTTLVYFRKGTPLPARKMFVHQTVKAVEARSQEEVLVIPVVQGESYRAHRNRLIGRLEIRGVTKHLPAGSRVEVTLHLDRSGQLHARADVPAIGQTFEEVVHVLVPTASLETIAVQLESTRRRIDDVRLRAFRSATAAAVQALQGVPELLDDAEHSLHRARGGDADAAQKAHRLLLDAETALDDAEAILAWPDLESEAQRCSLLYTGLVAQWGTKAEQGLFEQALAAVTRALAGRNAVELERQLQAMNALAKASYCRNPESMANELDWLSARVAEAVDVGRANQLIERSRVALGEGDAIALRGLLSALWDLQPSAPEQQTRSYGSSIR